MDVYLVFKNKEGKTVEHPISQFVARSEKGGEEKPGADEHGKFPHTFLFAGSLLWQIDATGLPAVGSKVTLRLRPQLKPAPKAGQAGQPPSVRSSGTGQP